MINRTVEHLLRISSGFDAEVIVIDGDREETTIKALRNDGVIKGAAARGRGKQMNKGASLAGGSILLFLHSDTELPGNALSAISSVMDDAGCAGGAFDLGVDSDRSSFRLLERMVYLRTRLTRVPFGDQAIFIRKRVFDEVNGFQETPVMEDLEFMKRLKTSGHKIHIIPQKVKTSPRRWEKEGVFYCTLRNWMLRVLYHSGVHPDKLVRFYYPDWK